MGTAAFWILVVMGFATFFVHAGVNVHIAAYLRDEGLSLTNAASVVTASWVVSAAGSVGWGWLMERVPARLMYSAMMALLSGAVLLLWLASGIVGAFAAAVLIGLVAAGGNIIPAVVYADYYGRASLGKIRGIGETGVLVGQSTGPLLAGAGVRPAGKLFADIPGVFCDSGRGEPAGAVRAAAGAGNALTLTISQREMEFLYSNSTKFDATRGELI